MSLRFVLASGSPRRSMLLEKLGVTFDVIPPDVDESVLAGEAPEVYVERLSIEKAMSVGSRLNEDAFVLAADTTVIHDGEILGKPADEDEARRMLLRLRANPHRVCTGYTLLRLEGGEVAQQVTDVVCTWVYMRNYPASQMERWIKGGYAFDKAGGYAIQSSVFPSVERIEGSYDNVVGLPTESVKEALEVVGWG